MISFAFYETATGRIISTGIGSELPKDDLYSFGKHVDVVQLDGSVDPGEYYVDLVSGKIERKLPAPFLKDSYQIMADGISSLKIEKLPPSTLVVWPDERVDMVDSGFLELSIDLPGNYTLIIDTVQYLRKEVKVEAIISNES